MISKTYQAGLLQASAYRILRERTKSVLSEYDISDIDWSILGLLQDKVELTPGDLADILAVKVPFITKTCKNLMQKGLITKVGHDLDGRSFYFLLTDEGDKLVKKVEPVLRKKMVKLIYPISTRQLSGYVKTLEKIVANYSHSELNK
jgi:DNA-binding MarR family transcriptional regulator